MMRKETHLTSMNMDPDDVDNMTGVEVSIVIESHSPTEVNKVE